VSDTSCDQSLDSERGARVLSSGQIEIYPDTEL